MFNGSINNGYRLVIQFSACLHRVIFFPHVMLAKLQGKRYVLQRNSATLHLHSGVITEYNVGWLHMMHRSSTIMDDIGHDVK